MGTSRSRSLTALGVLALAAPFNLALRSAPTVLLLPLLIWALGVGLVAIASGRPATEQRRLRLLAVLVGATVLGVWLSAATGDDLALHAATAARVSVVPIVALAVAVQVKARSDAVFVLRLGVLGVVAALVLGSVVLVAGRDLAVTSTFFGTVTQLGSLDRLTRPWAHANVAAMSIGAAGAGVAAFDGRRTRWTLVVLLVLGLVATASRGGLAALAGVGLVWVVFGRDDRTRSAAQVGIAGAAVLALVLVSPSIRSRVAGDEPSGWWGVAIEAPATLVLDVEGIVIPIVVENQSSSTWTPDGPDAVELSARFARPGSEQVTGEQRWPLPRALEPGDRIRIEVLVESLAPVGGARISWDLLIDRRAYFRQFSDLDPVLTEVEITASVLDPDAEPVGRFVDPVGRPGRREIWASGLRRFGDHPFLGTGPGGYATGSDGLDVAHGHSLVVEPLVAWGLVGTVPLLLTLGGTAALALRRAWASTDVLDHALGCGVVAVVGHGLVDWHLVHVSAAIPVGLLIGLVWAPLPLSERRRPSPRSLAQRDPSSTKPTMRR